MILRESKDLSLSLSLSFLPLTFGHGKSLTCSRYRELPRELMLAGQLETVPGRRDSWRVKSWLLKHIQQLAH